MPFFDILSLAGLWRTFERDLTKPIMENKVILLATEGLAVRSEVFSFGWQVRGIILSVGCILGGERDFRMMMLGIPAHAALTNSRIS